MSSRLLDWICMGGIVLFWVGVAILAISGVVVKALGLKDDEKPDEVSQLVSHIQRRRHW